MAIVKIKVGIKTLFNATNFEIDKHIHKEAIAQAKVLNINGTIIDLPALPGIIKTSKVIAKYATSKPPNIEQIVLNKPIFLPLFSTIDNSLYILKNLFIKL